ncbi:MAG TPA: hypothetical protein PL151_21330 [Phycisphaerae bacterium]|nr:hypothetical protein [Phycisphaerae bacterium]HOJ72352.1 hypothetical protein [Phycisphaerae bacterium]HOM49986.1 hypothetical protein [Phycisphaerae bacterium]HON66231.1 hypothetical protein [Phycisphaerae bacterium]HPP26414.1 hypothetical protein [Phycisphaerae bacterium]
MEIREPEEVVTQAAPAGEPLSPRLAALAHLVQSLDEDEMRRLPAVLSEQILARERRRARELLPHVGERCDVIWPGQAEEWDVLLGSVDVEAGIATIESSPRGRKLDVPACCVIVRTE